MAGLGPSGESEGVLPHRGGEHREHWDVQEYVFEGVNKWEIKIQHVVILYYYQIQHKSFKYRSSSSNLLKYQRNHV